MNPASASLRTIAISVIAPAIFGGCAYEIAYDAAYVPDETPRYVADGKILIVMPEEQQEFVYEGSPDSVTGDSASTPHCTRRYMP